jgi:hypothetical protein
MLCCLICAILIMSVNQVLASLPLKDVWLREDRVFKDWTISNSKLIFQQKSFPSKSGFCSTNYYWYRLNILSRLQHSSMLEREPKLNACFLSVCAIYHRTKEQHCRSEMPTSWTEDHNFSQWCLVPLVHTVF